MKRLRAATLLLTAALAGCSRGRPIDLPEDPAVVGSFEVTRWQGSFLGLHVSGENTITNRRRIADILAFLEAHNTDYRLDDRLPPTPQNAEYTIRLRDKSDGTVLYLHFGRKWLGGAEWPTGCRDRQISAAERERLVELFAG